jgi:hypothetical protein
MILLAVLAVGARPDVHAAEALTLHYDVFYLAFRVLSVDVQSHIDPAAYRTSVSLRTAGLFAAIAPWWSSATVSGTIEGPTLRPSFYRVQSEYRDRAQRIDLEYGDAGRVGGGVDGVLTDGERDDVPEPLRAGTMDPVTAEAVVAQRLAATGTCAGTVRVFDGLRRYDLRYDDLGVRELEPSRHDSYRGSARLCRASVDPIAGFLRSGEQAGERATEVSAWLAPTVAGAAPVAVRIDLSGTRGTLHAHLVEPRPDAP